MKLESLRIELGERRRVFRISRRSRLAFTHSESAIFTACEVSAVVRTHPHQELSAGQVVVVIGENVRQLLKRLHAVSRWSTDSCLTTAMDRSAEISHRRLALPSPAEARLTHLCTQAQALFSLYSGLDCSADTMARRDEKFLRIRHSCWGTTNTGTVVT